MDAEESSDESDSELDEKGTDVYCKTVFFKPALKLHKKKKYQDKFSVKEDFSMQILLVF